MSDPDGSSSFLEDVPFTVRQTLEGIEGELEVTENLLVPGRDQVRISVLASVADVITGVLVSSRTERIALTVDLSVRLTGPVGAGVLQMGSRIMKFGRTLSAAEASFRRDGHLVAHSWATFMASHRAEDTVAGDMLTGGLGQRQMDQPFADALGIRVVAPGMVEAERRPYILQPAGTIQGGVVCAMAEVAAETLTDQPITEIDVRYLSTIRVGPGRAEAELLDRTHTRTTVFDAGRDDRRAASIAFARSDPSRAANHGADDSRHQTRGDS